MKSWKLSWKIAQSAMVGVLALAGCYMPTTPILETTSQGITPAISEIVPPVTETPSPTSTATLIPTETPTPTEIPMPVVPESVITESLGLLDTTPVKDEETGEWTIKDMVGKTFWRWNNETQQWEDERPLYWQCGRGTYLDYDINNPIYSSLIDSKVKLMPTGLISDGEITYNYDLPRYNYATVRVCLKDINPSTEPLFADISILGKVIFYDSGGNAHEYKIGMSREKNNGQSMRLGFCWLKDSHCQALDIDQSLNWLDTYYNNPRLVASRQIDLDFFTRILDDYYPKINSDEYLINNRELALQIIEALKTGTNFPENVPDDFFLWATQFHFVGDYIP